MIDKLDRILETEIKKFDTILLPYPKFIELKKELGIFLDQQLEYRGKRVAINPFNMSEEIIILNTVNSYDMNRVIYKQPKLLE